MTCDPSRASRTSAARSSSPSCRGVRRGFTLVELLVVIGIIALLVGILLPTLNNARRSAQNVACLANLRSIGQGFQLYASENQGFVLLATNWNANADTTGLTTPQQIQFARTGWWHMKIKRYLSDTDKIETMAEVGAEVRGAFVCPSAVGTGFHNYSPNPAAAHHRSPGWVHPTPSQAREDLDRQWWQRGYKFSRLSGGQTIIVSDGGVNNGNLGNSDGVMMNLDGGRAATYGIGIGRSWQKRLGENEAEDASILLKGPNQDMAATPAGGETSPLRGQMRYRHGGNRTTDNQYTAADLATISGGSLPNYGTAFVDGADTNGDSVNIAWSDGSATTNRHGTLKVSNMRVR